MMKAFSGLRVLDFTTTIAGPHCTRLMADLGAEVIKIEAPAGDMMRTRLPLRNGASSYFGQLNAGKKSVVLDLKSGAAVAAVHRLAADADILVENFRPGVMQRLGLDYAVLGKVNRRYPAPKPQEFDPEHVTEQLELPTRDAQPSDAASASSLSAQDSTMRAPSNSASISASLNISGGRSNPAFST